LINWAKEAIDCEPQRLAEVANAETRVEEVQHYIAILVELRFEYQRTLKYVQYMLLIGLHIRNVFDVGLAEGLTKSVEELGKVLGSITKDSSKAIDKFSNIKELGNTELERNWDKHGEKITKVFNKLDKQRFQLHEKANSVIVEALKHKSWAVTTAF
jgi:hypothetical protein